MDNETFRCPNCCNSAREESLLKSTKTIFLTLATFHIPCPCHFRTMSLLVRYTNYQLHLLVVTKGMNTRNRSRFKSQHAFFCFCFFYRGVILITGPPYSPEVFSYSNVHDYKVLLLCLSSKKGLVPKRGFDPICGFIC